MGKQFFFITLKYEKSHSQDANGLLNRLKNGLFTEQTTQKSAQAAFLLATTAQNHSSEIVDDTAITIRIQKGFDQ